MTDPFDGVASATSARHLQLVPKRAPGATIRSAAPAPQEASKGHAPAAKPATRVYIDRNASGAYVYHLVNVSTGQVLAELPRAQRDGLGALDTCGSREAAPASA